MTDYHPIVLSCQAVIVELCPIRYPTIADTAQRLGIPVRTLQRRLQARGLSYSGLVEAMRCEVACRLIEAPEVRMAEVAKALGYADPSSFSRAFRRWHQMSPREYRQRVRSQQGPES